MTEASMTEASMTEASMTEASMTARTRCGAALPHDPYQRRGSTIPHQPRDDNWRDDEERVRSA
jgi:hypothetical protein